MVNELTESTVKSEALTVEQQAHAVEITTNEQYESAATILQTIKTSKQKFIDFFAPSKKAAATAHKAICTNEKACTDPCDKAEYIIKGKMLTYQREEEVKRRAAEAEVERLHKEESERMMAQAAESEKSGDIAMAELQMVQAEMVAEMPHTLNIEAPKAAGISTKKIWQVTVTDDAAVPSYVSGVCVRPVDTKKLLDLRRLNPNVKIAGVIFEQTTSLAVR